MIGHELIAKIESKKYRLLTAIKEQPNNGYLKGKVAGLEYVLTIIKPKKQVNLKKTGLSVPIKNSKINNKNKQKYE